MSLLITRPRYDKPTNYLFHWAEKLIEEARRRGLQVFDLQKDKARRETVASYLDKQAPTLVIFNGHGAESSVYGQDGELLVSADKNVELLKDKKVFIRACSAGRVLGPEMMRVGAKGFVGYREPFVFVSDKDSENKPLRDGLARPFLECSNQIGLSLIKGNSVKEAHEAGVEIHSKVISNLLTSRSYNSFLIPFLLWNMTSQVYYEQKN